MLFKLSKAATAFLLSAFIFSVQAQTDNGQFNVTVNLQTKSQSNSVVCRSEKSKNFYSAYTVFCISAPSIDFDSNSEFDSHSFLYNESYKGVFQASMNGIYLGAIDSYISLSSETSWRVINLIDHQYFEMLINW